MRRKLQSSPTRTGNPFKRIIEFAESRRRAYLRRVSKVRRAEAEALRIESKRLLAELGSQHPKPIVLERAALGAEKLAEWAEETVGRAERCPSIKPGDWMVMGRIITRTKEPTTEFVVGLSDRDGKFIRQFPKVTVDSRGEFYLVCRRNELARFKQHPQAFLKVADKSGNHLFSSKHPVPLEQGRVEYLDLKLARTAKQGRIGAGKKRRGKRRSNTS